MRNLEEYKLGVSLALEETKLAGVNYPILDWVWSNVKRKGEEALGKGKNWLRNVGGGDVDNLTKQYVENVMKQPYIEGIGSGFASTSTVPLRNYVKDVISGKVPLPTAREMRPRDVIQMNDMFRWARKQMGPTQKRQLLRTMREGQQAVAAEAARVRDARINAGLLAAIPLTAGTTYGLTRTKSSAWLGEDDRSSVVPVAGAATASALPFAQAAHSGAVRPLERTTKTLSDIEATRKNLRAGDVLLMANPTSGGFRNIASIVGSDPRGYHVAVVNRTPARGSKVVDVIHAPGFGAGGGGALEEALPIGEHHIQIRRLKDKMHRRALLRNVRKAQSAEDLLHATFGEAARGTRYNPDIGISAGLRDLLPTQVRRAIASCPVSGSSVCSTLVGKSLPVPIVPGIPGHEILPHHIQTSNLFETIGRQTLPETKQTTRAIRGLKLLPLATRAALAAGLGYGAYRGLKSLTAD